MRKKSRNLQNEEFWTLHRAKVVKVIVCSRRGQKSKVHNHTLPGKNPEQKILFFHDENLFTQFRLVFFRRFSDFPVEITKTILWTRN